MRHRLNSTTDASAARSETRAARRESVSSSARCGDDRRRYGELCGLPLGVVAMASVLPVQQSYEYSTAIADIII